MLLERGVVVSYETVRRWASKFGPGYALHLKRKTASRRDIWHLDEVIVSIHGESAISGALSIRTAMCSMRSSKSGETPRPHNG